MVTEHSKLKAMNKILNQKSVEACYTAGRIEAVSCPNTTRTALSKTSLLR